MMLRDATKRYNVKLRLGTDFLCVFLLNWRVCEITDTYLAITANLDFLIIIPRIDEVMNMLERYVDTKEEKSIINHIWKS